MARLPFQKILYKLVLAKVVLKWFVEAAAIESSIIFPTKQI